MKSTKGKKKREYTVEFKVAAARRVLAGESVLQLSRELEVSRWVLYGWRDVYRAEGAAGFEPQTRPAQARTCAAESGPRPARGAHRRARTAAGSTSRRAGFFRRSLPRVEPRDPRQRRVWRERIYSVIERILAEGPLSVERLCALGGVSRAGYYRRLHEQAPREHDMELRDCIQRIALANRRYGYRRVAAELRRQGLVVNHKKVLRIMREDDLLAAQKRRWVATTDSNPCGSGYPNLAPFVKLDGIDQLWQADITYVRLREAFVYLAVVLDAFSRRVVGWRLGKAVGCTPASLRS